jgi:hypothetical protein
VDHTIFFQVVTKTHSFHDGSIFDRDNQQFRLDYQVIIKPIHHLSPNLANAAHDPPDPTGDRMNI